eukprot:2610399-Lingulodinium_polyedra.AAC.1
MAAMAAATVRWRAAAERWRAAAEPLQTAPADRNLAAGMAKTAAEPNWMRAMWGRAAPGSGLRPPYRRCRSGNMKQP